VGKVVAGAILSRYAAGKQQYLQQLSPTNDTNAMTCIF